MWLDFQSVPLSLFACDTFALANDSSYGLSSSTPSNATSVLSFSLFYATMPMHNSREQFMFSFTYVVVITSLYQSATSKQTVKEDTAWSKGMNGAKYGYISASLVD